MRILGASEIVALVGRISRESRSSSARMRIIAGSALIVFSTVACNPVAGATVASRIPLAVGITAGAGSSCALLQNAKVQCWGRNDVGQLGDGTRINRAKPVPVLGLEHTISISAGDLHTCALIRGGQVKCWGSGTSGELGNGKRRNSPKPVVTVLPPATQISAGQSHTCAVLKSTRVACWGSNTYGQLGNGSTTESAYPSLVPKLANVVSVSSGGRRNCALLSDGKVTCWGDFHDYCSDVCYQPPSGSLTNVLVDNLTDAVQVTAGGSEMCAVRRIGKIACWGFLNGTQLTVESELDLSAILSLKRGDGVKSLQSSGRSNCAVLSTARIACWGANESGQLGTGTTDFSRAPALVPHLNSMRAVALGGSHACGLQEGGRVYCWGERTAGQLGNGIAYQPQSTPVAIEGLGKVKSVSGGLGYGCGVDVASRVLCWGGGLNAQTDLGYHGKPMQVVLPTMVRAISSSSRSSCAVLVRGDVSCWGWNGGGQLGDGSQRHSATPIAVADVSGAKSVSVGDSLACALLDSNLVKCWGTLALRTGKIHKATLVPSIEGASSVVVGSGHACAVVSTSQISLSPWGVRCWGVNNFGQLGDGTHDDSVAPVIVDKLSWPIVGSAVAAGEGHSCALIADGRIMCWGLNSRGQLGNGSKGDSTTPIFVKGISDAKAVTASGNTTCALLAGGTVRCWGANDRGQLGNGGTADSSKPVLVKGVKHVSSVTVAEDHVCAVASKGAVQCWGSTDYGLLGLRLTSYTPSPVRVLDLGKL